MAHPQVQKAIEPALQEEHILVVKRSDLFYDESWHGIRKTDLAEHIDRIKKLHSFQPRSLMEVDPTYKQVIPYIVFTHDNRYFLMQRKSTASEQRLRNKMSLGIGGHMRIEDMQSSDIVGWAMREFDEEVSYAGTVDVRMLGLLNDDSNEVGRVHVGLVMLFDGSSKDISVKSELKSGQLVSLDECEEHYSALESWSQMVFDVLKKGLARD
jgi:predicted NUDIX family phosphoesterase